MIRRTARADGRLADRDARLRQMRRLDPVTLTDHPLRDVPNFVKTFNEERRSLGLPPNEYGRRGR